MIPILTYHSVRHKDVITPDAFADQMYFLSKGGYRFLSADELYQGLLDSNLPSKSIMITFDDGYFDLYSSVFPILKKYDIKATVFVITSRIRTGENESVTARESHIRYLLYSEKKSGFLSPENISEMQSSGLVDFQSHSHNHVMHFGSDKIHSFYNPEKYHHWSIHYACEGKIKLGTPLYRLTPSLASPRYIPDIKLSGEIVRYTATLPNKYFYEKEWKHTEKMLDSKMEFLLESENFEEGKFETDEEAYKRALDDLSLSRNAIREITSKDMDYLAWPWGIYSPFGYKASADAGFKLTFSLDRKGLLEKNEITRFTVKKRDVEWLEKKLASLSGGFMSRMLSLLKKKKEKRLWNPQR